MPNFIEIGETTLEKSVTKFCTPFSNLAFQGTFWAKGHRSVWWGTKPPLASCKISSRSDDLSPRYLLPNLVDFVRDPRKHKKHSKRIFKITNVLTTVVKINVLDAGLKKCGTKCDKMQ